MSPLAWTNPDIDRVAAPSELADCRKLAHDEMWRMDWERMWPPAFYDPRFMPPAYAAVRPFWLGAAGPDLERRLVDFCMYSKGYRLTRAPSTK